MHTIKHSFISYYLEINKMTTGNILACIVPTVKCSPHVIHFCVSHYNKLFGDDSMLEMIGTFHIFHFFKLFCFLLVIEKADELIQKQKQLLIQKRRQIEQQRLEQQRLEQQEQEILRKKQEQIKLDRQVCNRKRIDFIFHI